VATLRVLRTAKATLSRAFALDEAVTPATGSVGVAITRLDGSAVESGNATGPDANNTYAYVFGGRDVLDELIVTWTATVGGDAIVLDQDTIEVVGGFFFGLAEGRASDSSLASQTKYPTAELIDKRIETEDECERICGQAFVPRFRRVTVNGTGRAALIMPDPLIRAVRAVQIGNVTFTAPQAAAVGFSDSGMLYLSQGWIPGVPRGTKNITVEYEHGWDRPPPGVVRVSKLRFKSLLQAKTSQMPDRAERQITVDAQGGSVVYGSPSENKTGLPEVDAEYARHPSPRPGFG
jgi:hypothetical protein